MYLYIYYLHIYICISKYISAIQEFAINSTRRAVPDAPAYGTQAVSLYGKCIYKERVRKSEGERDSPLICLPDVYMYMHLGIFYMFALIKSEVHFYGLFVNFK